MQTSHPLATGAATDGACSGNPGPGGWAVLIRFEDGSVEEFGGREESTTNNRMELLAALKSFERLKEIPRQSNLEIKTDSKYLINGLSNWIENWKKKGWITSNGKPVLNKDLWEALDAARLKGIKLVYVKGHSGEIDNDRVDKIAVSFSKGKAIALKCKKRSSLSNYQKQLETKAPHPHLININKLLSQLELVEKFAETGYGLKSEELSKLIDLPLKQLEQKNDSFKWRDWVVKPINNNLWRIQKDKTKAQTPLEADD